MDYDFTGGRIFHVSIDFCMGLTTAQRKGTACDSDSYVDFDRKKHIIINIICFSDEIVIIYHHCHSYDFCLQMN